MDNPSSENESDFNNNLRLLSHFICHRRPDRTFHIKGHYFPVCTRCTGLYIGAFSYFIFVYFIYVEYTPLIAIMAILMILPTFFDGLTQLMGIRESKNIIRFFSGLIGGVGLAILVKAIKWYVMFSLL